MSETINPGEGWRLLETDEVVQEGDEFIARRREGWMPSTAWDDRPPRQYRDFIYRRRIEQPSPSGWIPCDPKLPGHRPPTEDDADECGYVHVQRQCGGHAKIMYTFLPKGVSDSVAWAPIPKSRPAEPYTPPVVEQEPTDAEKLEALDWWTGTIASEPYSVPRGFPTVRELVDAYRKSKAGEA